MKKRDGVRYGLERLKWSNWTLFTALVMFVFGVFVSSVFLAALVGLLFYHTGILTAAASARFPIGLIILFAPCIIIGTIMTICVGKRPLRPFQKLIDAYQQVAAGNFDVRLPDKGFGELRILNDSFNNMARELGSIETLRNDFVSNISHEFKTPVVSIKGFAKLLKKEDLPEERKREYLDIIIAESERLSRLSSNVLLLSKLDSQQDIGELTRYPLDEQLRRAILVLEPQCRQKSLELDIDLDSVTIETNEELFHHVWLNLLSNAVKFSLPGGCISVALRQSGGVAVVTVSDQGVGMEPQVRERLFDKFYQGDKSRATEGNGLGLSLVQRIIQLGGGSIRVESEPEQGARFTVRLPTSPEGQAAGEL